MRTAVWRAVLGALLFFGFSGVAPAQSVRGWKKVRSDLGFEINYPNCWKTPSFLPAVGTPVSSWESLTLEPSWRCGLEHQEEKPYIHHHIRIQVDERGQRTMDGEIEDIQLKRRKEKRRDPEVELQFFFNRIKLDGADALAWAEVQVKRSRSVSSVFTTHMVSWHYEIFCPESLISIDGPNTDPTPKEYLAHMKESGFPAPPPEIDIVSSIHCIPRGPLTRVPAQIRLSDYTISKPEHDLFSKAKVEIRGEMVPPEGRKFSLDTEFGITIGGAKGYRFVLQRAEFETHVSTDGKGVDYAYKSDWAEALISSSGKLDVVIKDVDLSKIDPENFHDLRIYSDFLSADSKEKLRCDIWRCSTNDKRIFPDRRTFRIGSNLQYLDGRDFPLQVDFVDVLEGRTLVKRITCLSDSEMQGPCYPVPLSTGGFLLVDCYEHDAVDVSCIVRKFDKRGERDRKFKFPFQETRSENDIGGIRHIAEIRGKNEFEIEGDFQYSKIDGLNRCQRNYCESEEECVGFGGYSFSAKLTFDLDGNLVNTKFLEDPHMPAERVKKMMADPKYQDCIKGLKGA